VAQNAPCTDATRSFARANAELFDLLSALDGVIVGLEYPVFAESISNADKRKLISCIGLLGERISDCLTSTQFPVIHGAFSRRLARSTCAGWRKAQELKS
jgi:hypothetical protein